MQGSTRGAGLLFWIMTLVGGAVLMPCVLLPPWFEYVAQRERLAAMQTSLAQVEQRLVVIQKQIEHIQTDAAYVERLYRQEFGAAPPVAAPPATPEAAAAPAAPAPSAADAVVPEITRFVDDLLGRYPAAYIFVRSQTRPVVMLIGGGMIVTAVVLLGRVTARRAALEVESEGR
ncbi:hypothetical protein RAS1_39180 [Phycisphaerae bacterium RAS1]|nr:hypothetical protein RAS1_39180 [Phycisphaerae bacterium RAS1]